MKRFLDKVREPVEKVLVPVLEAMVFAYVVLSEMLVVSYGGRYVYLYIAQVLFIAAVFGLDAVHADGQLHAGDLCVIQIEGSDGQLYFRGLAVFLCDDAAYAAAIGRDDALRVYARHGLIICAEDVFHGKFGIAFVAQACLFVGMQQGIQDLFINGKLHFMYLRGVCIL